LIGIQVFGCTVLLLVTGLFSRSLLRLLGQDKGFETGHVALAEVRLARKTYRTDQSRAAFDDAILAKLRAIAGVKTAGLVSAMPLEGESWIDGIRRADRLGEDGLLINLRWASPGFFEATRARLVAGRFLEDADRNRKGIILSEGVAKRLWPTQNAIGSQVVIHGGNYTVVGVIADSRNASLKAPPPKMAWLNYTDQPPYTVVFVARGEQAADALAGALRQGIWQYAPDITIARVKTFDAQLSDSLAPERFETTVLISFGTAALLLAMLGIYGVLSYSTEARKPEIGLRMALGATHGMIYKLTLSEAATPVTAGLATGSIAGIAAGRAIRKLLYETSGVDPAILLIVAVLFTAAAITAALLPARRAAAVDPMDALRSE
jgi:predicted permease